MTFTYIISTSIILYTYCFIFFVKLVHRKKKNYVFLLLHDYIIVFFSAFFFFFGVYIQLTTQCHLLSASRTPYSISYKACLLKINSLSFCLTWNIFIYSQTVVRGNLYVGCLVNSSSWILYSHLQQTTRSVNPVILALPH